MEDCHTDSELLTQFHKNTPQLRFSGFNDEWEEKNFSEITYISATKNKSNLPLESYSITNENGFIPQDEQFENGGTMKDADKRMYWIVPPKSFGYNPARINVGSIGYYDGKKDVIVSSLYEIFKMTENCDDAFFWQWFKSEKLQKLVERLQEGGVRLYFYYDKLCMGKIKIPSLSEQQKIGTMLSKIDSLIQAKTKKLESLKAVKKSLLQKCFPKEGEKVPQMRFEGYSGEWEEKKLGEIAEKFDYGLNAAATDFDGKNKYLRITDIDDENRYFKYDDVSSPDCILSESENYLLRENDIVFARTGASVGKTYIYNKQDGIVYFAGFLIRAHIKQEYDSLFIFQNTLSEPYNKYIQITSQRSGQPGVNAEEYKEYSVMCPPTLAEQQKIGQFFSKYDSLISAQQKEIDKLKEVKKALLQKMFC